MCEPVWGGRGKTFGYNLMDLYKASSYAHDPLKNFLGFVVAVYTVSFVFTFAP